MKTKMEWALEAALRGCRVFPIRPNAKAPALITGWQEKATTDPLQIMEWWNEWPDANIGENPSGFILVDVDTKNGAPGIEEFKKLGYDKNTTVVSTPSGGFHFRYKTDIADLPQPPLVRGAIDVRTNRGYVLAPGSEIEGKAYKLVQDKPALPAPQSLIDHCRAGATTKATKDRTPLIELDQQHNIDRAVRYLQEEAPFAGRNERNNTLYRVACHVMNLGVSKDAALDILDEHYNQDPLRCYEPLPADEFETCVASAWSTSHLAPGASSIDVEFGGLKLPKPEEKPRTRRRWHWQGEPVDIRVPWLIRDRLPRVGTAMLVAPSGSGKTFLGLQLAKSLATKEAFFGKAPREACGTIYLSAEGETPLKRRMIPLGTDLPIVMGGIAGLGKAEEMRNLLADIEELSADMAARGVRMGMIVFDTLAASGLLNDENNNSECAAAVKALEALAEKFQCLVVVTHHPPKNQTGARGGSALHAGFDVVFEIAANEGKVHRVDCTKSRDSFTGPWGAFTLQSVVLGTDADGETVTTCTVSMSDEVPEELVTFSAPKHQDKFEEAFDAARADNRKEKGAPVTHAELKLAFTSSTKDRFSKANPYSASGKAFAKCFDWALKNAKIRSVTVDGQEAFVEEAHYGEEDDN